MMNTGYIYIEVASACICWPLRVLSFQPEIERTPRDKDINTDRGLLQGVRHNMRFIPRDIHGVILGKLLLIIIRCDGQFALQYDKNLCIRVFVSRRGVAGGFDEVLYGDVLLTA